MPQEIDAIQRQVLKMEIERQALKKEKDSSLAHKLKTLEENIDKLKKQLAEKKQQWEKEKEVIVNIQQIKENIQQAKAQADAAEKVGDLNRVAEIRYGELIGLDKELKKQNDTLVKLQAGSIMLKEEVTEEDIARVVAEWTGVPVAKLVEADTAKLLKIEERLKSRVIGQDEAVGVISACIKRSRSGLADENRPLGCFIFLGPTGVGKTKLAKALSWFLFDDEEAIVRLDMSEYMEKFSVSRLIGAPPGYVGYEEGGQLTEKVRRRPYSVVLLDEIEKAHPDVFNIFLQILDEGRLTDGQGRTVNFKNTLIIMTSNIGQEIIQQQAGIGLKTSGQAGVFKQTKDKLIAEVKKAFRPEFLNRIDDIIVFSSLDQADMHRILELELEPVYLKLKNRMISIELSKKAKEFLIEKGFDTNYGARPLKRTIQKYLQDPLAGKLLEASIKGGDKVTVDLGPADELVFKKT